jgi:hypothetical protein
MARIQKTVTLKVLIECEEGFDINNLGVCVVYEASHNLVETEKGMLVDDLVFTPRADYCEIVEYIEIKEDAR